MPPLRPNFSFRVKVMLIYSATVLCLIFALFAAGSYYINFLQKRNKQDAVELAEEQARELAVQVWEVLRKRPDSDLSRPDVQSDLSSIMEFTLRLNKSVVIAGVFDRAGNRIIEQMNPGERVFRIPMGTDGHFEGSFQTPAGQPVDVEFDIKSRMDEFAHLPQVEQPIPPIGEGEPSGYIRLRVAESPTFRRISDTSRQITGALVIGCGILFLFLLVVFWTLWRLFSRQLDLLQRNERLDRMAYVGTLASGLAHEIRNPLSSMNVNLEVMKEELAEVRTEEADRARTLAASVQREVSQLASTLTSFLEFALPRKEGMTEFSLRGLVEELVELHAEQMRQAGITWEVSVHPPGAETQIEADRRLIHQAVRNVLLNAIQILGNALKKQIRVRVEAPAGSWYRVLISDSGPGIAPENLDKIFEVFFSTRKGGSGFGLAIAKKIVEEHGGRIRAENNPESLGATFVIELPKKQ